MKKIYLASGNTHKLHELQTALDQAGLPVSVSGPNEIGGMPELMAGFSQMIAELRLMLLMDVPVSSLPAMPAWSATTKKTMTRS